MLCICQQLIKHCLSIVCYRLSADVEPVLRQHHALLTATCQLGSLGTSAGSTRPLGQVRLKPSNPTPDQWRELSTVQLPMRISSGGTVLKTNDEGRKLSSAVEEHSIHRLTSAAKSFVTKVGIRHNSVVNKSEDIVSSSVADGSKVKRDLHFDMDLLSTKILHNNSKCVHLKDGAIVPEKDAVTPNHVRRKSICADVFQSKKIMEKRQQMQGQTKVVSKRQRLIKDLHTSHVPSLPGSVGVVRVLRGFIGVKKEASTKRPATASERAVPKVVIPSSIPYYYGAQHSFSAAGNSLSEKTDVLKPEPEDADTDKVNTAEQDIADTNESESIDSGAVSDKGDGVVSQVDDIKEEVHDSKQVVVDTKEVVVVDNKEELVIDKKEEVVVDKKEVVGIDKKEELVVDKKEELVIETSSVTTPELEERVEARKESAGKKNTKMREERSKSPYRCKTPTIDAHYRPSSPLLDNRRPTTPVLDGRYRAKTPVSYKSQTGVDIQLTRQHTPVLDGRHRPRTPSIEHQHFDTHSTRTEGYSRPSSPALDINQRPSTPLLERRLSLFPEPAPRSRPVTPSVMHSRPKSSGCNRCSPVKAMSRPSTPIIMDSRPQSSSTTESSKSSVSDRPSWPSMVDVQKLKSGGFKYSNSGNVQSNSDEIDDAADNQIEEEKRVTKIIPGTIIVPSHTAVDCPLCNLYFHSDDFCDGYMTENHGHHHHCESTIPPAPPPSPRLPSPPPRMISSPMPAPKHMTRKKTLIYTVKRPKSSGAPANLLRICSPCKNRASSQQAISPSPVPIPIIPSPTTVKQRPEPFKFSYFKVNANMLANG